MQSKYFAMIFMAFMCNIRCTEVQATVTVEKALSIIKSIMATSVTNRLYKGMAWNAGTWSVYFDKQFHSYNGVDRRIYDATEHKITIYVEEQERTSYGRLDQYLDLDDTALLALYSFCYSPVLGNPVIIDPKIQNQLVARNDYNYYSSGKRYVFDFYITKPNKPYFILNEYKIGAQDTSIAKANISSQEFLDASVAQPKYQGPVNEDHKMQPVGNKLKSKDGNAEIELTDDVLEELVKIAHNPESGAVIVEKVLNIEGANFQYRFVISWGKYNNARGIDVNAFFVSTSRIVIMDSSDDPGKGQKPARIQKPIPGKIEKDYIM